MNLIVKIYFLKGNGNEIFAHSNKIRIGVHCDGIISILCARRFAFMTKLYSLDNVAYAGKTRISFVFLSS